MTGLFSPDTLEQVRAASDIIEVIGAYIPLKRAGANFVALCPFHKEKSPSFSVNGHRQIFHCFGCHKGGDVFTFVKEYENVTFPEAVKRLADRARIPLEIVQQPGQQRAYHLKETLFQIHEQITQRWQTALNSDPAGQLARDYLAKRGVSSEAVKLFRLGCAPDLWDDTVNWAKSKSFPLELAEQAGLIIRKEGTDRHYDRFRGRLMFPICDEQGRVIGFSGRILSGDEKTAKYVNSPETPLFTKSKVIFGLDKSKRALLDAKSAILCEGQLDLIACHMNDVRNVVAPQGTAFTNEHARILKRYVEEVVLCFDSDRAGQSAAIRSFDALLASGLAVRVVTVPAPHDPDSFIKEFGGAAFRNLVAQAQGYFDFLLDYLCATNDPASDKGRLAIVEGMTESLNKTGNEVLRDKYAQKTALRLGVNSDAVRTEFKKTSRTTRRDLHPEPEAEESPSEPERPPPQEFWLLKLLLIEEECARWAADYLDLDWITHAALRHVIGLRFEAAAEQRWSNAAAWLSELEGAEARSLVTEVLAEDRAVPNPQQQIQDVVLRLRNQSIDRQIALLTQRISDPGATDSERLQSLHQQQEWRSLKRQPLQPLPEPPLSEADQY
jgi:DNA primase